MHYLASELPGEGPNVLNDSPTGPLKPGQQKSVSLSQVFFRRRTPIAELHEKR